RWWNPPWRANWNHSWHQAHAYYSAGHTYPNNTTKWIRTQQRAWDQLHRHHQRLMTTIGIHSPTPLCRYNNRPANLIDQPTKLINSHETNPGRETRSPQPHPAPAPKQRQTPHQHTTHRQPQPTN
ncbi:hypothetical protein, partial [Streptomyces sp. 8ZJF_21]|uniref:hypothetical protein n=1 Tax=Streptomyces sp. 8ZJF_21 TaxID=2903141 RepID=UPI001E28BB9A